MYKLDRLFLKFELHLTSKYNFIRADNFKASLIVFPFRKHFFISQDYLDFFGLKFLSVYI